MGNRHRYQFLLSICLFSVIPSAPPLLFSLLPACIIQEDEPDDDKWRGQRHRIEVFLWSQQQWIQWLPLQMLGDVSMAPLCPPQPLPTWGILFTLLVHLVPGGSFVDGALTMTTMTITMTRIKPTRMTFDHLRGSNSPSGALRLFQQHTSWNVLTATATCSPC